MVRAVNMLMTVPISNVTANPFTVPEPNANNTKPAIIVVTLPSKIEENASLKPESMDAKSDFPIRSSSLILSKIMTLASTAMPIERIIPATPGSVIVTPIDDMIIKLSRT